MAAVSANEVADFFIWRARETGEPITHLKVQKLVYYAHAWYLALTGERLINARFQAWVHGPVCRELYNRFRDYSWKPITDDVAEPNLTDEIREHLEEVWDVYGGFTPFDLERMTHDEDPWQIARGELAPDENCEVEISERVMREYYRSRLGA